VAEKGSRCIRLTNPSTPRSVRSVLDGVLLVGLFIVVVADGVAQALEGALIPPVVATGWRWALLLPLVVCPLGISLRTEAREHLDGRLVSA
jgi:hypothetical protein